MTDYYLVLCQSSEQRYQVFTDAPQTLLDAIYVLGPVQAESFEELAASGVYQPEYWSEWGDAISACGSDEELVEQVMEQNLKREELRDD